MLTGTDFVNQELDQSLLLIVISLRVYCFAHVCTPLLSLTGMAAVLQGGNMEGERLNIKIIRLLTRLHIDLKELSHGKKH
jgi:hypothetical protein